MEKYTNMLVTKMTPVLEKIFTDMFEEAKIRGRSHRDNTNKAFKVLCEETINWNNTIIAEHTKDFESRCSFFSDLLAAVFICYINHMARAIRKESQTAKLSVQLPSNSDFIHKCINNMSRMLEDRAQILRERDMHQLNSIAREAITETLDELLPVDQILRTYLGGTKTFEMGSDEGSEPEGPDGPEDQFKTTDGEPGSGDNYPGAVEVQE